MNNHIRRADEVEILGGEFKNRRGTIHRLPLKFYEAYALRTDHPECYLIRLVFSKTIVPLKRSQIRSLGPWIPVLIQDF